MNYLCGQKQKIAIASVLAIKPKVLILDEPTTMLDPNSKNQIYKILENLKQTGITIIYITRFCANRFRNYVFCSFYKRW